MLDAVMPRATLTTKYLYISYGCYIYAANNQGHPGPDLPWSNGVAMRLNQTGEQAGSSLMLKQTGLMPSAWNDQGQP